MADVGIEKQKVKEITDKLEEGLKELFESEKYKKYLNTMSKFHNYSANNIQLIAMQRPDATYVAGYRAWQNNFKRHVNKGEKGIHILAPAPYKIKEKREKIDSVTNELILDEDGMPVVEEVEIKIPAFRVVTVFDYEQTDGKELPNLGVNELYGNVKNYQDFMEALKRVAPVPISYEGMEGSRKGYFLDLNHPIVIKEGMSEAQTAKTGIHEVVHAKLHAKENEQNMESVVYKDRETMEVEAESIAYTVCQHFEIDTSDYSFGYIAGWSSGKEMPELKSSLDIIRRTSSELIKGIETQLLEIEKEKVAEQAKGDIILLVENFDRSEYELLNVRGIGRNELLNSLSAMRDDDRQNVEAYLERSGAWITLLGNEQSKEVAEYHLDYAYNTETHKITDFKALQEENDMEKANLDQSMKLQLEESTLDGETELLYGNKSQFGIYQLKDTEETRNIRFVAMDYLEMKEIPVLKANYELVYIGEFKEGMNLEDIYTKFNIDSPMDFTGHSLSVSDVVVVHQDGENTSYYVDTVGYREVPEFIKEIAVSMEVSKEEISAMEETEKTDEEKVPIMEEIAEENMQEKVDTDKVSYYVIEDLSTWADGSPQKSSLERFDSLPEAVVRFAEYQGKDLEDKPDMARATLGVNVNGSEFDVIHVRNNENCLSLDFTWSKKAGESRRFMEDLQVLHDEIGFDKVRVRREMSPAEIKDFVKQRFEYQLKSSGLEDVSLYMDRFDVLYEQGKMGHLMPTATQKHIVEDVPFSEWENPYINAEGRVTDRTETEIAVRLADRYIGIQEVSGGYDYTIYDINYRELDGGIYDNPDITIRQALNEIIADLKESKNRGDLEGNIHIDDELILIDYDRLIEKAEKVEKENLEERIRNEVPEAARNKVIADFKAKTENLFNGINGQTQEDIELSVYAYLQSKIDEYAINVEFVDVAVAGSRCRGLEGTGSDLDVVVEYRGTETEDNLFNVFNEDDFMIGGVKVDINPITEGKTGTLVEYLPKVEEYLEEKRAALQEKNIKQEQKEKQTIVTLTVAECGEFHNLGEYHEDITSVEEAIAVFNRIPPERMNGIRSIGINIHIEGTESYEDIQMDIMTGKTIDLEMLEFYPQIIENQKALAVISELIDKFPKAEVFGSLDKWLPVDMQCDAMELDMDKIAFLAAEIDKLSYTYDTCQYKKMVENRDAQVRNIIEDIRNGNIGYLNAFLNAITSEGVREGITEMFGQGLELDNSKGVQIVRKANELLDKLAEYEPLAKMEELEEGNCNMIDGILNNEKPKVEEEHNVGRISIKEKLEEKKAIIKQMDRAEKGTEKKSQRGI